MESDNDEENSNDEDESLSEWLLFNANSAISWQEQVNFNEMMIMAALY
jgi:hypothetical protein